MKKIVWIVLLLLVLVSCWENNSNIESKVNNTEKSIATNNTTLNWGNINNNTWTVNREKSDLFLEKSKLEQKQTEQDKKNEIINKFTYAETKESLVKIRKILEKNSNNIWTGIPALRKISDKKNEFISWIESINSIIDSFIIESLDIEFIRFSDVIYNSNNSLWLYTICTISKKEDKSDIKNKSWTEREYCWLLEYNFNNKENTVIFLWDWWWHWWHIYIPKFRYNYNNDIIYNNSYYYPRKYIYNLIDNESSHNFTLDKNDINIYSWGSNKYNSIPDTYSLTGAYIWVYCYLDCWISYEKDITYSISKNYKSEQWIRQDIKVSYYNLEDDFENLKNSTWYKEFFDKVPKEINKSDIDYINSLNKDEFNINLSFKSVNPNLSTEEYNKDYCYTWSWSLFKIKWINPKEVRFNFNESKNIEHPYLRVIWIESNKYNWLFIYNINNAKFLWLEKKWNFEWWRSESSLIISWEDITLTSIEFNEDPIILEIK